MPKLMEVMSLDDKSINVKLSEVVEEISEIFQEKDNKDCSYDHEQHGQAVKL